MITWTQFRVGAIVALALLGFAGSPAHAVPSASFDFTSDHCTGGCLNGGVGGTVTVSETAADTLHFDIVPAAGFGIIATGAGSGTSFGFNLAGDPTITFSSLTSGFIVVGGNPANAATISMNGAGDFEYGVSCNPPSGACGNGGSAPYFGTLSFDITASGLTLASLEQNAKRPVFRDGCVLPVGKDRRHRCLRHHPAPGAGAGQPGSARQRVARLRCDPSSQGRSRPRIDMIGGSSGRRSPFGEWTKKKIEPCAHRGSLLIVVHVDIGQRQWRPCRTFRCGAQRCSMPRFQQSTGRPIMARKRNSWCGRERWRSGSGLASGPTRSTWTGQKSRTRSCSATAPRSGSTARATFTRSTAASTRSRCSTMTAISCAPGARGCSHGRTASMSRRTTRSG